MDKEIKLTLEEFEKLKRKADKWDALDKKMSEHYAPDSHSDLADIGEDAARAFGWL